MIKILLYSALCTTKKDNSRSRLGNVLVLGSTPVDRYIGRGPWDLLPLSLNSIKMVRVNMTIQRKLNFLHFDIAAFTEFYLNHTITLFHQKQR